MTAVISNEIKVDNPTDEFKKWCKKNLEINNPDYDKKKRMGKWLGDTPRKLVLYRVVGNTYYLPYGTLTDIADFFTEITSDFPTKHDVDYSADVPLYDYQEIAVKEMLRVGYGVLESKAGSGKTQMGIAMISQIKGRALWLTHTKDLLTQSKERATEYMDSSLFGEITAGKVNVGKGITFATVQTLVKVDPTYYRDLFDVVIVDECHRVAGSPTKITQFGKVLNNLNCKHKFGLSATVHRADGLIKTMFAYLGRVTYTVPDEDVADRVMPVNVIARKTGTTLSLECLDTDGTILYQNLISYLTKSVRRNMLIANDLALHSHDYNLILSDRLTHLEELMSYLPSDMCVMIDGGMTSKKAKAEREQALQDMRDGKKHYLFATYKLAKEGLDIPRLNCLYLTTPQKDYAVVTQSVGRVARVFEGKSMAICYDYVDNIEYLIRAYKKRCSHYRKSNCVLLGEG